MVDSEKEVLLLAAMGEGYGELFRIAAAHEAIRLGISVPRAHDPLFCNLVVAYRSMDDTQFKEGHSVLSNDQTLSDFQKDYYRDAMSSSRHEVNS